MITIPTLLSGGADGSDLLFGEQAELAGHHVCHFTFEGHKHIAKNGIVLSDVQLLEGAPFLMQANKTLRRTYPSASSHINALLRRNYWQVKTTQMVFAVAPLSGGKEVGGGTAWAVQMAIDNHTMVYLFDLYESRWNKWCYSDKRWEYVLPVDLMRPRHFERYTGIGSRKPGENGTKAIRELYL